MTAAEQRRQHAYHEAGAYDAYGDQYHEERRLTRPNGNA